MKNSKTVNFFFKYIFSIGLCSTGFIESSYSSEKCNAKYVGLEEYVSGKCVTFHECPPLLKLIRSPSLTGAEIKLLQSLTCRVDGEIPTICCAIKDIKELVNYNSEARPGNKVPTDSSGSTGAIIYPTASDTDVDINSSTSNINFQHTDNKSTGDDDNEIKIRNNFKLLPKLEECGETELAADSDRIIGGIEAQHGAFPWMARIGYLALKTGEIEFYCGATVINKKYVLTAAHCTEEVDTDYYKPAIVRLGEHDSEQDLDCSPELDCSRAVDFKIEKTIPHPGYNPINKTDDIELIRVHGTIPFNTPFVKPICLPFHKEYEMKAANPFALPKGVVTGWGRTQWDKQDGSPILQKVILPIVSNEECQRNYSSKIELWEKQMCAGGQVAEDSCGGDSGGPIAVPVPTIVVPSGSTRPKRFPRFFQLGVVSFGPTHCGVGGLPGVYTRVSAYKDWILSNLES